MDGGKPKRTIGSIETYEAPSQKFSKHIITEGHGDTTPSGLSECDLLIHNVDSNIEADTDMGEYKLNSECHVTIGNAQNELSDIFDEVVCSMKEGEVAYVKIKMPLENGEKDDVINKQPNIKVKVQLTAFNRLADVSELEPDEKLERANIWKDKGSELFRQNNFMFAARHYKTALECLTGENYVLLSDMKLATERESCIGVICFNMSAACLKLNQSADAINVCKEGLAHDNKNVKGYYRLGQAYLKQHDYSQAKDSFLKALQLDPDNRSIKQELAKIDVAVKQERQLYRNMFATNCH